MSKDIREEMFYIAQNLKKRRTKYNQTQKEFAKLLKMNYQNYSKLERGLYTPSLDKILDICLILGMSPNELILNPEDNEYTGNKISIRIDNEITDIKQTMKVVEEIRAKAFIAKAQRKEKEEKALLLQIIGIFAWRNEHYWDIADYLYFKTLNRQLKHLSDCTVTDMEKIVRLDQ